MSIYQLILCNSSINIEVQLQFERNEVLEEKSILVTKMKYGGM